MPVDWDTGSADGLVSIGTHSLHLSASGPARSPNTPAVICITGMGDPSIGWSATIKHISAFARVYIYDRTGLGSSELPPTFTPDDKSYRNIATELKLLLDTVGVAPPYVLVMHSMGGIPGREFLDLYPDEVAGMVFLDTVTENNYKTRPEGLPRVMRGIQEGLDESFLWTVYKPEIPLAELKRSLHDEDAPPEVQDRQMKAIMAEVRQLIPSSDALATKKQFETVPLGNKPVSVIKGDAPGEWRRFYQLAVAAGKASQEDLEMVRKYLSTADEVMLSLQFKQLRLSRNSRMVEAVGSWHNVHWYRPDLVAKEVQWCMHEFASQQMAEHTA